MGHATCSTAGLNNASCGWPGLNGANLVGAKAEQRMTLAVDAQLNDAHLSASAELNNARPTEATLNNASLYFTELNNAKLNGAVLKNAEAIRRVFDRCSACCGRSNRGPEYAAKIRQRSARSPRLSKDQPGPSNGDFPSRSGKRSRIATSRAASEAGLREAGLRSDIAIEYGRTKARNRRLACQNSKCRRGRYLPNDGVRLDDRIWPVPRSRPQIIVVV